MVARSTTPNWSDILWFNKTGALFWRRSIRTEPLLWSKISTPKFRSTGVSVEKITLTVLFSSSIADRSRSKILESWPVSIILSSSSWYDFSSFIPGLSSISSWPGLSSISSCPADSDISSSSSFIRSSWFSMAYFSAISLSWNVATTSPLMFTTPNIPSSCMTTWDFGSMVCSGASSSPTGSWPYLNSGQLSCASMLRSFVLNGCSFGNKSVSCGLFLNFKLTNALIKELSLPSAHCSAETTPGLTELGWVL